MISVGIATLNPRLKVRSSPLGMAAHTRPADARATFQSPLHCMYVQSTHCKTWQCVTARTLHVHTMQRIAKHRNASPRSCRGEWKLARNTRNAYTKRQRMHARQTRGRPSSRPYTACMYNAMHCKNRQCLARMMHVCCRGIGGGKNRAVSHDTALLTCCKVYTGM